MRQPLTAIFAALALACAITPASPQDYPNRPVRIIVPTAAGSAQDIIARLLQPYLERGLKQPVIIDNRSGASTMIGTDAVAKASPDGHTLLIVPTTFTINAALNANMQFDPLKDLEPVTVVVKNSQVLTINAKLPARTVQEFIALAKSQPGQLNYASAGPSTQPFLLLEMLSARAGIKLQHVPYRGGGPAALSVGTGETQVTMLAYSVIRNHVEAGNARALATGGLTRDPLLPDLPTVAESGFPGFEGVQWLGLLTTGGTPRPIVDRINAEVNRALSDPELKEKLALQGTFPAGSTPDEFRNLITSEIRNWRQTAQAAGIELK
jgi:tripartite-type tricarboxylate transporter receptor subunit TctC